MLDRIDDTPTRLQRDTARLVRVLGVVALVVSAALVAAMLARGQAWLPSLLSAIALALAMLPEEFALAMTVFFVIGAWRLAQQRVLARRSAVIETLGAATVLAVDKTGTLTENRMSLRLARADGGECKPEPDAAAPPPVQELLRVARRATREHTPDPLDRALRELGEGQQPLPLTTKAEREYPVAVGQPFYAQLWSADTTPAREIACKGSAEAVLALCGSSDAVREAAALLLPAHVALT